jgi:putative toxin-antitoxin system antitoxin component (TIGR02293 family)
MMDWLKTIDLLGGRETFGKDVVSGAAFVETIERGLPRCALDRLKRFSHLTDSDLSIVIPRRKLANIKRSSRLSPRQSDRIARTAAITVLAQRVFGNVEAARDWLLAPNLALDWNIPLRLLRTWSGAQLVESVLTRITMVFTNDSIQFTRTLPIRER